MNTGRTLSGLAVILATVGCAPPGHKQPVELTEPMRKAVFVGPPVNANVSYMQSGDSSGTRVILVHGTPGSGEAWTDYLINPPAGAEILALDRPGFGRSGPQGSVTSLVAQAAAVAALLPTDGRRAVLLGHSLGGAVIAQVAAAHPAQVSALVFIASSLDPAQEKIHPMQPVGASWPIRVLLPRAIRNSNEELMAFKAELQQLEPLLKQVTVPFIIVHGTQDDLVPFANVAFMQSHLSAARCSKTVVLPGLNHFLPWNSEPTVRDAIAWATGVARGATC
jgi:pimeloyl-ACP methyl ester carboxylesterase